MSNQKILASSLEHIQMIGTEEKAGLRLNARRFGGRPSNIEHYLSDDVCWHVHRGDLILEGDLDNDLCLVVEGNLTIRGNYNDYLSDIGYLLCLGDMRVQNVLSWNAFCVAGNLYAAGMVFGYYNDFPFDVCGDVLKARGVAMLERAYRLPEKCDVEVMESLGREKGNLQEHLNPRLLSWEDEDRNEISIEEAIERLEAGEYAHACSFEDWETACALTYTNDIFLRAYALPDHPTLDDWRIALLQPDLSPVLIEKAAAIPELSYDIHLLADQ